MKLSPAASVVTPDSIGSPPLSSVPDDTPSKRKKIAALSGGNVQRAVLARELGHDVEVLIAANPCFGLDFAAAFCHVTVGDIQCICGTAHLLLQRLNLACKRSVFFRLNLRLTCKPLNNSLHDTFVC